MKFRKYLLIIFLLLSLAPVFAQSGDSPFAADIRAFLENDKISPPPQNAIVFAGSSSFTLWKDVQRYFPGYTIVNRAFGGSTLPDQLRYARQIIIPLHPKQIVLYCGENDFAASDTIQPETVAARFKSLFKLFRSELPETRITYVSMKPSPSRWRLAPKFVEANKEIRKYIRKQKNADFVSVWKNMLDQKHQPDRSLFVDDMLHMNAKGYKIWQKLIQPKLIK